MICGNDPNIRLTPGDQAVVDWFREWLAWDKTPADQRGPEPAAPVFLPDLPDGRPAP